MLIEQAVVTEWLILQVLHGHQTALVECGESSDQHECLFLCLFSLLDLVLNRLLA